MLDFSLIREIEIDEDNSNDGMIVFDFKYGETMLNLWIGQHSNAISHNFDEGLCVLCGHYMKTVEHILCKPGSAVVDEMTYYISKHPNVRLRKLFKKT